MPRGEQHAHRWPSMVRGAMLARPTRRATYHRALESGELIPQKERKLKCSEGSGMLIGDPLGEGSNASSTNSELWEQRTHPSEWEGTQTPRRERQAHRWPSKVRGAMLARPIRRATYHRAPGSGELILQNERETQTLRREQICKSVVRRSSATSSGDKPWPSSRSFGRSVWYAWSTAMVCNEATAWPAAAYALPFKRDVSWRG